MTISWADIMAMEKVGGHLRRADASLKKQSPVLDVDDVRRAADAEIAELRATADEEEALRHRLCDLLRDIAYVLRGEPPELTSWGFTGLDLLAARLLVERDELYETINELGSPRAPRLHDSGDETKG